MTAAAKDTQITGGVPEAPPAEPEDEKRMSFMEHLSELRQRLRNAGIAFLLATFACFYFAKNLFEFLTRPVRAAWIQAKLAGEPRFNFASMAEPMWVYMKIALVFGLLAASPFIFWEIWKFIAPGLYRKEKRLAFAVTLATGACFTGGAIFGYQLIAPKAAYYLLTFAEDFPGTLPLNIEPALMMNQLFGFLLMLLAGCGVAFELPVILGMMGWLGLVTTRGLWKFNRFALVLSVIAGGILTPGPDVLSQLLMAGPLFILYNLSIIIVWLLERRQKKEVEKLDGGPAPDSA